MTKILVLSDTHGFIDDKVIKYVIQADEVWHAGDIGNIEVTDILQKYKPLRAVYGNIDDVAIRSEFPHHQRFVCDGVDVWITHIGGSPGRYNPEIREEMNINPPKLFICGHSHILKIMHDPKNNLLFMNPGAAGKYGLHKVRTMIRFYIEQGLISNLEVIEMAR